MVREAAVPIPLALPLRPFRAEDAAAAARLNDAAGHGLALHAWRDAAGPEEDPWEYGRRRQVERMESGQCMVVVDTGSGAEGLMVGNSLGAEPEDPSGIIPIFQPLIELENRVRGSWYLNILAVAARARRRGHARRLLAAADAIALAGGHDRISLIVSDANPAARSLYDSAGYRFQDSRPMIRSDWDGAGESWLLLVKPL